MRTKEEARQFIENVLMMSNYDIKERFLEHSDEIGVDFRPMQMSIKTMERITGKNIDALCRQVKECEPAFVPGKFFVTIIKCGIEVYKLKVFYN